jgi:hypothetical protein
MRAQDAEELELRLKMVTKVIRVDVRVINVLLLGLRP